MQQRMDGLSAAASGTAEDVYLAYNAKGNANADTLLEGVFRGAGQSNILSTPYSDLTDTQKQTFVSLCMRAEGFNNNSGSTVASTPDQANPATFALAGWMLGVPLGGLNFPVDYHGLPGDTFAVSPDGNTLTINTATGPIVYTTNADTGKGTVSFAGTSVPIDGNNLQSINNASAGVNLNYPSSSQTINLDGTTTGALSPIDLTFPTGDIAWTPVSGGNWTGTGGDGTQYYETRGFDEKNNPTTVLSTVGTDSQGNLTASHWSSYSAGASPDNTMTLSGITGPVTPTGSGISVGGDLPFSYSFITNTVLGNDPTATINGSEVTVIGAGSPDPIALFQITGGTSSSTVTLSTVNLSVGATVGSLTVTGVSASGVTFADSNGTQYQINTSGPNYQLSEGGGGNWTFGQLGGGGLDYTLGGSSLAPGFSAGGGLTIPFGNINANLTIGNGGLVLGATGGNPSGGGGTDTSAAPVTITPGTTAGATPVYEQGGTNSVFDFTNAQPMTLSAGPAGSLSLSQTAPDPTTGAAVTNTLTMGGAGTNGSALLTSASDVGGISLLGIKTIAAYGDTSTGTLSSVSTSGDEVAFAGSQTVAIAAQIYHLLGGSSAIVNVLTQALQATLSQMSQTNPDPNGLGWDGIFAANLATAALSFGLDKAFAGANIPPQLAGPLSSFMPQVAVKDVVASLKGLSLDSVDIGAIAKGTATSAVASMVGQVIVTGYGGNQENASAAATVASVGLAIDSFINASGALLAAQPELAAVVIIVAEIVGGLFGPGKSVGPTADAVLSAGGGEDTLITSYGGSNEILRDADGSMSIFYATGSNDLLAERRGHDDTLVAGGGTSVLATTGQGDARRIRRNRYHRYSRRHLCVRCNKYTKDFRVGRQRLGGVG